jgi:hypothetical protein
MPSDATPSKENQPAPLSVSSTLARLAAIGVVILLVVGGFLYLGGWFNPHELTPARFVNGFEKVFGIHSGFRRNHAKGGASEVFSIAMARERASRRPFRSGPAACRSSAASRSAAAIPMLPILPTRSVA